MTCLWGPNSELRHYLTLSSCLMMYICSSDHDTSCCLLIDWDNSAGPTIFNPCLDDHDGLDLAESASNEEGDACADTTMMIGKPLTSRDSMRELASRTIRGIRLSPYFRYLTIDTINASRVLPHILQDLLLQDTSFMVQLRELSPLCRNCKAEQRNYILRPMGNPLTSHTMTQAGLFTVVAFVVLVNPQIFTYIDLIMILSLCFGPCFLLSFECVQVMDPTKEIPLTNFMPPLKILTRTPLIMTWMTVDSLLVLGRKRTSTQLCIPGFHCWHQCYNKWLCKFSLSMRTCLRRRR